MTRSRTRAFAAFAVVLGLLAVARPRASAPISIYAMLEKVIFEPAEQTAERVQLWGAFMYVDGGLAMNRAQSAAKRGYMYFMLPPVSTSNGENRRTLTRTEWNDLKSVVGTGQAVGFGNWMYFDFGTGFTAFQPDAAPTEGRFIAEFLSRGGAQVDLRVRPASEPPANPAMYQTNTGVVKLTDASHPAVVRALRDALK